MKHVARTLQDVAIQEGVSTDLQVRLLHAALHVALDVQQPTIQPPAGLGDTEERDIVTVLNDSKETLEDMFQQLPPKDPVLSAALSLASSLSAVVSHVETIINATMENEELAEFRSSLERIRSGVDEFTPWGGELRALAETIKEETAPVFPSMPSSSLPAPGEESEEELTEEDEEVPVEEETEEELEDEEDEPAPRSMDDILTDLGEE